jgi:hypothetical protein
MMNSFFQIGDFVSLWEQADGEVDKRDGSGQHRCSEDSFTDYQTSHDQGTFLSDDEKISPALLL